MKGPTGIRTQVKGFKVPSTNHYTMEPEHIIQQQLISPTGIRTQVKGFKVPSTNHYTMEPEHNKYYLIFWVNNLQNLENNQLLYHVVARTNVQV
ncbi:hypothetical protein TTHERM_000324193 (macronuclear) [Tetrahymena thermophila SB210]|uniref:Uncharacterized protein n=1 Tax=Tetrahymena thermophila (strain SB210) TaxID=312017 RepID=W7XCH9_TETTS|nr:hypothetical protein TTHERM_000324193 [Tetrahymena thermophila SB210]EWS75162.1 hypothetical protein TTHERM_000324193 [Tetrahymena thermophila SB210]|eukprot:XP_012652318.1 hypothetical protein TTHERM_000324193 [Tetrahymena thermophila SB210]